MKSTLKYDFLNYKTVIFYVLAMTAALLGGVILKDYIALVFVVGILWFCFSNNLFRALELFLIWFFIANFFIGQGYLTIELLSKYISKPYFLLVIIFVFFFKYIPKRFLFPKYIIFWILFLIVSFLSATTQGQSPFGLITASSFFLLFMLMQARGIKRDHYYKFLNLFVAAAVIQTGVSVLQVLQIIPPPSEMMDNGSGGQFLWVAGLDDVASGTFGPAASPNTSWFAALMVLFMLIMWVFSKRNIYLLFMVIALMQFATVDSKTILAVTFFMLGFTLFYMFKERQRFKVKIHRYVAIIVILGGVTLGFISVWNEYYKYSGIQTGRTDLNSVYEDEAKASVSIILENLEDWGKIKGFKYVFDDFVETNPLQLIWGYGIQGFDYNGKFGLLQRKDAPLMRSSNLTNSSSGLITQFAVSGFVGFFLWLITFLVWFYSVKGRVSNIFDFIKRALLFIFFPFSFFAFFIYGIGMMSIPLTTFATIISIYIRFSEINKVEIKLRKIQLSQFGVKNKNDQNLINLRLKESHQGT